MPADKPVNGQHRPTSTNTPPPARPARRPLARLRTAWNTAWKDGGILHQRAAEVRRFWRTGWDDAAVWIKTLALIAGASLVVLIVGTAADIVTTVLGKLSAAPAMDGADIDGVDGGGLWATVDHSVRAYLTDQAAHLTVTPAALYRAWQTAGLIALVGGFFGNAGARLTWLLWGAASVAMVWSASPDGGRAAATGLAALMWALASIAALHGLTLRPVVHHHPPRWQFSPDVHVHAAPIPTGDSPDDAPSSSVIRPRQH
ncbi:hypothetical protein ACFU6S_37555 [Streptomyces sp. NPDC057456]|uniref:hypothetical protein n=1 Tax=Streptomyces sp. NPDC057456 TaxID=3346139 RepID=UPI0036C879F5